MASSGAHSSGNLGTPAARGNDRSPVHSARSTTSSAAQNPGNVATSAAGSIHRSPIHSARSTASSAVQNVGDSAAAAGIERSPVPSARSSVSSAEQNDGNVGASSARGTDRSPVHSVRSEVGLATAQDTRAVDTVAAQSAENATGSVAQCTPGVLVAQSPTRSPVHSAPSAGSNAAHSSNGFPRSESSADRSAKRSENAGSSAAQSSGDTPNQNARRRAARPSRALGTWTVQLHRTLSHRPRKAQEPRMVHEVYCQMLVSVLRRPSKSQLRRTKRMRTNIHLQTLRITQTLNLFLSTPRRATPKWLRRFPVRHFRQLPLVIRTQALQAMLLGVVVLP